MIKPTTDAATHNQNGEHLNLIRGYNPLSRTGCLSKTDKMDWEGFEHLKKLYNQAIVTEREESDEQIFQLENTISQTVMSHDIADNYDGA